MKTVLALLVLLSISPPATAQLYPPVTVTGTLLWELGGVWQPVSRAAVEVLDNGDVSRGNGVTDANGHVSITFTENMMDATYRLRFLFANTRVLVTDPMEVAPLAVVTPSGTPTQAPGNPLSAPKRLDFGVQSPATPEGMGPARLYALAMRAYDRFNAITHEAVPGTNGIVKIVVGAWSSAPYARPSAIFWPSGFPDPAKPELADGATGWRAVIHEFGHRVAYGRDEVGLHTIAGDWVGYRYFRFPDHCFYKRSAEPFAFMEGFPSYFAAVVDPEWKKVLELGQFEVDDCEHPTTSVSSCADDLEGSVATRLLLGMRSCGGNDDAGFLQSWAVLGRGATNIHRLAEFSSWLGKTGTCLQPAALACPASPSTAPSAEARAPRASKALAVSNAQSDAALRRLAAQLPRPAPRPPKATARGARLEALVAQQLVPAGQAASKTFTAAMLAPAPHLDAKALGGPEDLKRRSAVRAAAVEAVIAPLQRAVAAALALLAKEKPRDAAEKAQLASIVNRLHARQAALKVAHDQRSSLDHRLSNDVMPASLGFTTAAPPRSQPAAPDGVACVLHEATQTMHFWSQSNARLYGAYTLQCDNGFTDVAWPDAGTFTATDEPVPGRFRDDGWLYHGWSASKLAAGAKRCWSRFHGFSRATGLADGRQGQTAQVACK